jgi:two-component system cell cycle response regulator DivK
METPKPVLERCPDMAKRVLVVEDDLLNRMLYCAVLEADGFEVEPISDGAYVMEAARAFKPDVAIMDINLPNVSGLELIEEIRADETLRKVPVLAVTAYVGKWEEARIRRAGANNFLPKPVSIKPLLKAVNELIAPATATN